jgi:hypothetical protein
MSQQCKIGAMKKLTPEEAEEREWASPAFGVPKKNGEIRLVIDFRYLNQCLIRQEYPLPTIEEMFSEIRGFEFASVVDLSMGYLSLRVCKETSKLLTIVTIDRLYECLVLAMGPSPSTDIFQARMCHIFEAMPLARRPKPYLDDVFNGKGRDFNDHLSILAEIFTLLMEAGMQVNLTKSPLCAKVVEFMGMLMKQHGYQPTPKRVESILKIAPPKNVSEVRRSWGRSTLSRITSPIAQQS